MAIGTSFLTRYSIPLIVAAIFSGNMDIPKQMEFHEKNGKLADELLSDARGEGHTTETFDYIIVGGGAAGAVVANRLSASGQHQVLLLEAGGDPNPVYEVPFAQGFFFDTKINGWEYTSTKQRRKHCYDTDNYCRLPRGKGLGGGTSINDVLYNRGKPKDYDNWADFTGDSNWSWNSVHQTYNSFEDYDGFYPENSGKHGYGGELYVGKVDSPGVHVWEEAAREMGYQMGDLNGGYDFTYGFSRIDHNIKNGLRMGTYQAFLKPVLDRPNLTIYRYAYATKIEMEWFGPGQHHYKATGVRYTRHGQDRFVKASKEVIVSAGAFETPKLLMLSGIGPYEHLNDAGITCILNLPAVGKYLQDHPGANIYGEAGGFKINTAFARYPHSKESLREYIDHGTGPLNQFTFGQIISGYLTSYKNQDKSWPDLHTYVRTNYLSDNSQSFTFGVELERYDTWGTVKLNTSDPNGEPIIDTNILQDPEDIERIVDGIEQMLNIFKNSQAFRAVGLQEEPLIYRECRGMTGRDYWRCVVIHKTGMTFHTTSTCRMGPNHREAALDSKLKVFGTENLRVIDGSAIPFGPTGNTAMPCMLIGAKGAEIILSGQ